MGRNAELARRFGALGHWPARLACASACRILALIPAIRSGTFGTMRSEKGRVFRGRLVYISVQVVVRSLRVVLFLPLSVLRFGLHGRLRPQRSRALRDPYLFFRGTPGLSRTLQGPRRSRRRTFRRLSTSAASSCLLAVSAESRSPPRPRTFGIAPSTQQGVGTRRQSIIFAPPLHQTERRCRLRALCS